MLCFFNQNAPREISEFRATPAWVYLGLFWVYLGSILGLFWVCFDGADADGDGGNDDCHQGVNIKMTAARSSKNRR